MAFAVGILACRFPDCCYVSVVMVCFFRNAMDRCFLLAVMPFVLALFLAVSPMRQAYAENVPQLAEGAKIIVIGGALTETVYALGAGSQIVGRDTTGTYPPEAKAIKDVGYMRRLSAEGVLSLAREGILLVGGRGPKDTLDVLERASVPLVIIPEGYSREAVLEKIKKVGYALHKEKQANALAETVRQQFVETAKITEKITDKKRVLFILSIQNGRIMAAGNDTAASGIIELAGGVNAITGYSGYKLLNEEAIIEAAPDAVLLMSGGGASALSDEVLNNPAIRMTPAGKTQAIYQMDGLYLLGFGPRTASAARDLAALFYPSVKKEIGSSR